MGRRENIAASKRIAVMNSTDYKSWYYYRKQAPNPPSDPYRAYMIDKSLRAPQEDRSPWSKHPFEADWGKVDSPGHSTSSPVPTHHPTPKPQVQHTAPKSKPTPTTLPHKNITEEIKDLGKTMSNDYNTPNVDAHTFLNASSRKSQMALTRNRVTGTYVGSRAIIGINGSRASVIAASAHEFGHHVHARSTNKAKLASVGVFDEMHRSSSSYNKPPSELKKQYNTETAAWKIAQPYIDKMLPKKGGQLAIAKWSKKYALTTYSKSQTRDILGPGNYTIHFGKKRF